MLRFCMLMENSLHPKQVQKRDQYKKTIFSDWQLKDLSGVRPTAVWAAEVSSTSMASEVELVKRKTDGVQ